MYVYVIKRIWAYIFSKIDTYISGAIQQSSAKWVCVLYMYDYLSPQKFAFANIYVYTELHAHVLFSHVIDLKHSKSITLPTNLSVELSFQLADLALVLKCFNHSFRWQPAWCRGVVVPESHLTFSAHLRDFGGFGFKDPKDWLRWNQFFHRLGFCWFCCQKQSLPLPRTLADSFMSFVAFDSFAYIIYIQMGNGIYICIHTHIFEI